MLYLFYNKRRSAFLGMIVFNEQQIALVRHSEYADVPVLAAGGFFEGGADNLIWKFLFHGFICAERAAPTAGAWFGFILVCAPTHANCSFPLRRTIWTNKDTVADATGNPLRHGRMTQWAFRLLNKRK